MLREDQARLLDIAESLSEVGELVAGHTLDSFLGNKALRAAVQYYLIIAGEAVKQLSRSFREDHPNVAWREIAGNRDVLVHGYLHVNLSTVWDTATRDAPAVLEYIRPLLPSPED